MDDVSVPGGRPEPTVSFPRLMARTARFSLGIPRSFSLDPTGRTLLYLRSRSGTERAGLLWSMDTATGAETLVADPDDLLAAGAEEELTAEERARRERMREGGAGITSYAVDRSVTRACFALSSRLFVVDLATRSVAELPTAGPVVDPRMSPDGRWVAYVADGALHTVAVDGSDGRTLLAPDQEHVTFGLAEFVASEELERYRGHWWAADSSSLYVARVDTSSVQSWWVADPAHPEREPYRHRYPAAGTPNAEVTLHHIEVSGGASREIEWDSNAFPYLVEVVVDEQQPPLVLVMDRVQQHQQVLALRDGSLQVVRDLRDQAWVDVVPGTPRWWGDRVLTVEPSEDTHRLHADGVPVSPTGLQVRTVVDVLDGGVLVQAHEDPIERRLVLVGPDGSVSDLGPGGATVAGARAGGTTLLRVESLDSTAATVTVDSGAGTFPIPVLAADPGLQLRATRVRGPYDDERTVVLLPTGWEPAHGRLPVILSPYGGPHHAAVMAAGRAFLEEQWIADQGFAVVVADGRGTPGSPSWERAMRLDVAGPALDGQVRGLEAAATAHPDALDLGRVGIRGWSFGGYLAALAVLSRPETFHAGVAGAPPSDWALYDTAYTERYLGLPDEQPEAYASTSLLPLAARLERPLLIIHGMVDDNVVVAHSLLLSQALLEAGRPHQLLPLSGVTHMTPQEVVTENILRLELDFLRSALG